MSSVTQKEKRIAEIDATILSLLAGSKNGIGSTELVKRAVRLAHSRRSKVFARVQALRIAGKLRYRRDTPHGDLILYIDVASTRADGCRALLRRLDGLIVACVQLGKDAAGVPDVETAWFADKQLADLREQRAKVRAALDAITEPPEPPEFLEPDGGNLYRPHKMQVHSGQFWRCAHGLTGFNGNMYFIGCRACEAADPTAAAKFNEAVKLENK